MKLFKWLAKQRLGITMTMTWFSLLQFLEINFLFLASNYNHFQFLPFSIYIISAVSILMMLALISIKLHNKNIYKGEMSYWMDNFLAELDKRQMEIKLKDKQIIMIEVKK